MKCVVSITQMDIADAAGVTEVIIRNRYKDIKNIYLYLNPKSIPFFVITGSIFMYQI
jgi:hypothetical protein